MSHHRIAPLMLAPLALAACVSPAPMPEPAPADRLDMLTCTAGDYQQYVGQTSPQITLPAGTVFRSYRTGEAVTQDFAPARLNFEYDRAGVLVKVSCG